MKMKVCTDVLLLTTWLTLPLPSNELTCTICIDIITDIDEWLTSEKTEDEIIEFVKQVERRIDRKISRCFYLVKIKKLDDFNCNI